MSSQRNHVISCRVTEKLRLSLWTLWLFELDSPQLFERLTVTMRSSWWVWWRAWPPKQPLSCEIKGNGEKDFLWFSTSFVQNYFCGSPVAKKLPFFNPNPSLASERRRGEEEVEEDTSIPVSNNQSWKNSTYLFRENLSVHSFKSFSILIFLSLRRSMWPLRWGAI